MCATCLFLAYVEGLVDVVGGLLTLALFARVLQSWVPALTLPFGLSALASRLTEPVLRPIRHIVPPIAGTDFSPFVAFLVLQIGQKLLLAVIPLPI